MKSILSRSGRFATFMMVLATVLFAAGCSKHEDDCPAPENNEQESNTRAFAADQGADANDANRPAGVNVRNAEDDAGNPGDEGISDDGDDEADGEGNKKTKPAH